MVCDHSVFSVKNGDRGDIFSCHHWQASSRYREKTVTVRFQQYEDSSLEIKSRGKSHSFWQQSYIKKTQGKGDNSQRDSFSYGERLGSPGSSGIPGYCQALEGMWWTTRMSWKELCPFQPYCDKNCYWAWSILLSQNQKYIFLRNLKSGMRLGRGMGRE